MGQERFMRALEAGITAFAQEWLRDIAVRKGKPRKELDWVGAASEIVKEGKRVSLPNLAKKLNVSRTTIYNRMNKEPGIRGLLGKLGFKIS